MQHDARFLQAPSRFFPLPIAIHPSGDARATKNSLRPKLRFSLVRSVSTIDGKEDGRAKAGLATGKKEENGSRNRSEERRDLIARTFLIWKLSGTSHVPGRLGAEPS